MVRWSLVVALVLASSGWGQQQETSSKGSQKTTAIVCAVVLAAFGGRVAFEVMGPASRIRAYQPDEDLKCVVCNGEVTVRRLLHRAFHIPLTMLAIDPEDTEGLREVDRAFHYLWTTSGIRTEPFAHDFLSEMPGAQDRARLEFAKLLVELEEELTARQARLGVESEKEVTRLVMERLLPPPPADAPDWKILEFRNEPLLFRLWRGDLYPEDFYASMQDYLRNYEYVGGRWRLRPQRVH